MKNKKLIDSFNNAFNGIIHAIRVERNMKIHVAAGIVIAALGIYYGLSRMEMLIVCLTIAIVLICELFNTAVETLVDMFVDRYHPKAKAAKDVAAGAVLLSAVLSLLVGYFIFFDRVSAGLQKGIISIRQSPVHITVIALCATGILVLALKLANKNATPFKGGMPSGHAAIAFSITTAVALWTENGVLTLLCLAIALLVIQSRLEGKIHNLVESTAGAALGFLVTLLLFQLLMR